MTSYEHRDADIRDTRLAVLSSHVGLQMLRLAGSVVTLSAGELPIGTGQI